MACVQGWARARPGSSAHVISRGFAYCRQPPNRDGPTELAPTEEVPDRIKKQEEDERRRKKNKGGVALAKNFKRMFCQFNFGCSGVVVV